MLQLLNTLLLDESGQDMAEYAILIGLIALVVLAAVRLLGGAISTVIQTASVLKCLLRRSRPAVRQVGSTCTWVRPGD